MERKGRRGAVESTARKTEGAGKWKTRVKEGKTERGGGETGGGGGGGERREWEGGKEKVGRETKRMRRDLERGKNCNLPETPST